MHWVKFASLNPVSDTITVLTGSLLLRLFDFGLVAFHSYLSTKLNGGTVGGGTVVQLKGVVGKVGVTVVENVEKFVGSSVQTVVVVFGVGVKVVADVVVFSD